MFSTNKGYQTQGNGLFGTRATANRGSGALAAAFATVILVANQALADRSPPTCTANGSGASIAFVAAEGVTELLHGDEICFQVEIFNLCQGCCDVTLLNSELVLPDGSIVPITVDADVFFGDAFVCPGAPQCATASTCTIPGEVGYRYIVASGDEHGETGTNCPPTPSVGTGELSGFLGITGTVHSAIPLGLGNPCHPYAIGEISHATTVTKWESVLTHGTVGSVALEIPDNGRFSEPRSAIEKIVVTFDGPIDPATAIPMNVTVCGNDVTGSPVDLSDVTLTVNVLNGDTKMEINFEPGLPDYARYRIELDGVYGDMGPVEPGAGGLSRILTALRGDANSNRQVGATDLGGVRSLLVTNPITASNINHVRFDANNDGRINATDLGGIRGKVGNDARSIPDPVCQ